MGIKLDKKNVVVDKRMRNGVAVGDNTEDQQNREHLRVGECADPALDLW